jgi:carbonic anhydrase
VISGLCLWLAVFAHEAYPPSLAADLALLRLRDGNARFVEGKATHERQQADRRAEVAKGQSPFAIIVCCSDSRVPPEIVFDQGLGDLFVLRTAGNVVDDIGLGTIEYAVEHLHTRLVVVLGHDRCGAVSAAVTGGEAQGHVQAIVQAIRPAVEEVKGQPGDPIANAVTANVKDMVKKICTTGPILPDRIRTGKLTVIGARYDLDDGHVEFFK